MNRSSRGVTPVSGSPFRRGVIALAVAACPFVAAPADASSILWSSASGSAWLTGSNWTGSVVPGSSDVAQFGVNPTSPSTAVGINMGNPTNNGTASQIVGAIQITSARTNALIISNTSSTTSGTLTLTGQSIGSISNVVIENDGAGLLTLQNGATATLNLALGQASNAIVANGNITISSPITQVSGTTAALFKYGTGTLTLGGTNSFTGGLAINTGTVAATTSSALPGLGSAGAITVASGSTLALSVGGAGQFTAGQIDLARSNVAFGNSSTLGLDTAGGAFTYGSSITDTAGGTLGLVKLGANALTLTAANTFTGPTVVSAGSINLANANALQNSTVGGAITFDSTVTANAFTLGGLNGSTALVLASNAATPAAIALTVGGNNATTSFTGAISGAGSITKVGNGTLALGGSGTYTGGLNVTAGAVAVASTTFLPTSSTTLTNAATLRFTNATALVSTAAGRNVVLGDGGGTIEVVTANVNLSTLLSGTGNLTKTGTAALQLSGSNTGYSGTTTIAQGTLQVGYNGGTTGGLGTGNVVDNGNLQFNRSDAFTFANAVSGTGTLTQVGASTVVLSGSNSYSGGTLISAGAIEFLNLNSLPATGAINVGANTVILGVGGTGQFASADVDAFRTRATFGIGATLGFDTANVPAGFTYASAIADSGGGALNISKLGTNTLVLTGNNAYTGTTTVAAGTLQVGNGGADGTLGTGAVAVAGTLAFNRSGSINVASVISGAGSILQNGPGALTLSGVNTFTGTTTLNAGTLNIGNAAGLGAATAKLVLNGGVLNNTTGATQAITTGGTTIGGNFSFTGTNDLALTGAVDIGTAGRTITVDNGLLSFVSAVSGSGGITKAGPGTLNFTSTSTTYTGGLTINGGTVTANSTRGLGGGSALIGTLTINSGNFTYTQQNTTAAVTSGYNIVLNGNDSALGVSASSTASLTFDGPVSGPGSLTKTGSGILVLNGASSYSGTTTIAQGLLQIGNGGTTGTLAAGNVIDNGTLAIKRSDSVTVPNAISGNGGLTQSGAGTTILTGSNTYAGTTNIATGTLQVGNGGAAGTLGSGNVTNAGTLAFNRSDDMVLTNVISGAGAVVQKGPGKLTVTSTNTYTGVTTVNSGTTLEIGNGGTTGSIASTSTVNNGTVIVNRSDDLVQANIGGTMSGAGSLVKTGGGTLTLSGTNTQTGGLFINGGAVSVSSTNALQGQDPVSGFFTTTINNGSTLIFTGSPSAGYQRVVALGSGVQTVSVTGSASPILRGVFSGAGTLRKAGPGTLNLFPQSDGSATYTSELYTGGTVIDEGTLIYFAGGSIPQPLGPGKVTINSGTLQFNNTFYTTYAGNLPNDIQLGSTTSNITAGTSVYSQSITHTGAISGTGTLNKFGVGTLALMGTGNTYSGGTVINAGTVRANNGSTGSATGSGNVTVASGGTLGGNGTISGDVTVNAGGTITAGVDTATVGTLKTGGQTWAPAGKYTVKFSPTVTGGPTSSGLDNLAMTTLDLTGLVSEGGRFLLTVTRSVTGTQTIAGGTYYTIATTTGAVTLPAGYTLPPENGYTDITSLFTLNTAAVGIADPAGIIVSLSHDGDGGSGFDLSIGYQAAPEPTTAVLVGLGAGSLLGRRRRRTDGGRSVLGLLCVRDALK